MGPLRLPSGCAVVDSKKPKLKLYWSTGFWPVTPDIIVFPVGTNPTRDTTSLEMQVLLAPVSINA